MFGGNDEGTVCGQIFAAAYFEFDPHDLAYYPNTTAAPGEAAAPEKSAASEHERQIERA
jgi:hypothetical protein